jgi:NAD-dependent deacetylase
MARHWHEAAARAADIWREATCVFALTGAGISVPSGIPDFRSPGGLWERYRPEEVATLQALRSRPEKVWQFLREAALIFGDAAPNPGHEALAALESAGRLEAVVTQNIDGLHQRAGSCNVVEFHGTAQRFYCMGCRKVFDPALVRDLKPEDLPWCCNTCGKVVRPDFVFFGEQIPTTALQQSMDLASRADLVVIVGTSGEVAPANTLPTQVKRRGGRVLEFNLQPSLYSGVPDVSIFAPAEESLPHVRDLLL